MREQSDTPGLLPTLELRYGRKVVASHGWDSRGWDAQDFLHAFGSPPVALLSAVLFVPEFVEIEGAVFLKDLGPQPRVPEEVAKGVRSAREASREALAAYVHSYNWIELPYVFQDPSGTSDEYAMLAVLVAEAWRARLQYLYPTRRFGVRILPPEETGSVIGVGIEEEFSADAKGH